jgi:hypothetical protein
MPSIVYHIATLESIIFGAWKNMDQSHLLNDDYIDNTGSSILFPIFLVMIILFFYNMVEKETSKRPRN